MRRRLLVPEVVQTSAMDCGPASLTSLLEGLHIHASYGRLREACQTDVDGTCIDTLEEIATSLGLAAEQVMLPIDHVLLPEAEALPAIAVALLPGGLTHFIVIWSVHAGLVQVMDPASGRRWLSREELLQSLFVHRMLVPTAAFADWARSALFTRALGRRLAALGAEGEADALIARALARDGYPGITELDAAARMIATVVRAGGLARGATAARALRALLEQCREAAPDAPPIIPESLWTARPAERSGEGEDQVLLRGAVLLTVRGVRPGSLAARATGALPLAAPKSPIESEEEAAGPPPPELRAALEEEPSRPLRELFRLLRQDGVLAPSLVIFALVLASSGVLLEALILRSLISIGHHLGLVEQRIEALFALILLLLAVLLIEIPVASWLLAIGRRLEIRLRVAFLSKIPLLGDRYIQSRPASDMAARAHSVHMLRALSGFGGGLVRGALEFGLTAAGLVWLSPASASHVSLAVIVTLVVPVLIYPALRERDLRQRIHAGALGRFYLDALLGLAPIRTHGAERVVRREHEGLLVEWALAGRSLVQAVAIGEAAQALSGFAVSALLFAGYVARGEPLAGALLFVFWSLQLPLIGGELARRARQYPAFRNVTLRLLEPLGALGDEEQKKASSAAPASPRTRTRTRTEGDTAQPISIQMSGVSVLVSGHTVLSEVDLEIAAGEHVAVVGPSGAGKSTLVGLLLGWHRTAAGEIRVNGEPLDGERLVALRRATAWVDPAVQIWNRSLFENLTYGAEEATGVGRVLDDAELSEVIERLPEGLETALGEGGGLLSGGEGQRIRLGRAFFRKSAQLVILDEPFRGLDREKRHALLDRSRARWARSTLICITHDVGETLGFDRVIVVEDGKIVENGAPSRLHAQEGSRYRALLEAEESVRTGLWSSAEWRRLLLLPGAPLRETRKGP